VEDGRSVRDVIGVAILAALIALALAFGAQKGRRAVPFTGRARDITELGGPIARFGFLPTAGRISVRSADGRSRAEIEMSLVVDGTERPLVMHRSDVHRSDKLTLSATFPVEVGEERATGVLQFRMDPASDLLTAQVLITPESGTTAHTYALRFGFGAAGRTVFVPGAGTIADLGTTDARAVVVDDENHPMAVLAGVGAIGVSEVAPAIDAPGATARIVVSGRAEAVPARGANGDVKPARMEMSVLVGASNTMIWQRLYKALSVPTALVRGIVTGTKERAHIFALDADGRPQLRIANDAEGRFAVDAPLAAVQWFATLEAAATSAPVRFTPGTASELRLDVSPGGELRVHVLDMDTKRPVVARLIVKGVEGTVDPNFGPDYRASGAGPLMDVLEGEVVTPLPAGRYRVAATKGMEWSIDAETVEVQSGHTKSVDLALRHVVPTPGVVGCDLHVHARPSFDTPVSAEDRVLSLVSAGVDFAVPTEHNLVGDYGTPLAVLGLSKNLATVTGVEVTTYNPRFGHFGIFPFPAGGVPPYKGTNATALFGASKRGDPNRVLQVNHPRLLQGIGYFNVTGFDPKTGRVPASMRTDFDTLEVYNGYDLATRPRVEQVLDDWFALLNLGKRIWATGSSDSHRIQYQWAGYPRTMALVDPRGAGDTGQPVDPAAVVAAIKKGHTFVTSGPMIEFDLTSADGRAVHPGDDVSVPRGGPLHGRLRVRAAPWVDVTSVEVVAGTPVPPLPPGVIAQTVPSVAHANREVLFTSPIVSRPTQLGKELGSLEDSAARTVRFQTELTLTVPSSSRWIAVVVRGDRLLDDALPFMPVQPLAFTNPVWILR
jgi:hypothetical protein